MESQLELEILKAKTKVDITTRKNEKRVALIQKEIEEKDKISFQVNNTLQGGIDSNDNMIKVIEERQVND